MGRTAGTREQRRRNKVNATRGKELGKEQREKGRGKTTNRIKSKREIPVV